ncbi:hypothetical protein MHY1_02123 [Methylovirgula sp. HY1]|nr:hypothetical protein MHY1_02123 [Methylovirgula sp. HY1]
MDAFVFHLGLMGASEKSALHKLKLFIFEAKIDAEARARSEHRKNLGGIYERK